MALPILPKATFIVKNKFIPTKGKLEMQPFSVGQEAILLTVKDSESEIEKFQAMKQILQECILSKTVDIGNFPTFVVELLFLRLREKSLGEIIDMGFRCKNLLPIFSGSKETVECNSVIDIKVDLREIDIKTTDAHAQTVQISDKIGIKFKYPDLDSMGDGNALSEKDLIINSIESIFDDVNVYPAEDHTREELVTFYDSMNMKQKKMVYEIFFGTMPHIHYEQTIECPKCGKTHLVEFNSLKDVFI